MNELERWINPEYLEAYRAGQLSGRYLCPEPFKRVVLKNFFTAEALARIDQACEKVRLEESPTTGFSNGTKWSWGPYANPEVIRFIYGKEFRLFLNSLMDESLQMRASAIPQFNVFPGNSPGIPIHNDFKNSKRIDMVMLLQLSKEHQPGYGGELVFHSPHPGYPVLEEVKPEMNTLILFKVGEKSFHSVPALKGSWQRRVLAFDWFLGGNHACAN